MIRNLAFAAVALAAVPALAEDTLLSSHGRWDITHVAFDDGSSACTMKSQSAGRDGAITDLMTLWAGPEPLTFMVASVEWDARPRDVKVLIDVDREIFPAIAQVDETLMSVTNLSEDFLRALSLGSKITIRNADGEPLIAYSLDGSAAALRALYDCWQKLGPLDPSDPFGSAASVTADPF